MPFYVTANCRKSCSSGAQILNTSFFSIPYWEKGGSTLVAAITDKMNNTHQRTEADTNVKGVTRQRAQSNMHLVPKH
jgi:hypothetical protein